MGQKVDWTFIGKIITTELGRRDTYMKVVPENATISTAPTLSMESKGTTVSTKTDGEKCSKILRPPQPQSSEGEAISIGNRCLYPLVDGKVKIVEDLHVLLQDFPHCCSLRIDELEQQRKEHDEKCSTLKYNVMDRRACAQEVEEAVEATETNLHSILESIKKKEAQVFIT